MHDIRAKALIQNKDISNYLGETVNVNGTAYEVIPAWVRWMQPGIDQIRDIVGSKGRMVVEERVYLDEWADNCSGTADVVIDHDDHLYVNDYKGGAGIPVAVADNKQLLIYAAGAWARFGKKATKFTIMIDQPRNGGIKTFDFDVEYLNKFLSELSKASDRVYNNPVFKPTVKGCTFCPLIGSCRAHADFVLRHLMLRSTDFEKARVKLKPSDFLSPKERVSVVQNASMLTKFVYTIKQDVEQDLRAGKTDLAPGMKIVKDRGGNRQFTDTALDGVVAKLLMVDLPREKAITSQLISPSVAEDIVSTGTWEKLADYIERGKDVQVMAPLDDPRPSIGRARDLLDDLDSNGENVVNVAHLFPFLL